LAPSPSPPQRVSEPEDGTIVVVHALSTSENVEDERIP
jgi:hypothetical protein